MKKDNNMKKQLTLFFLLIFTIFVLRLLPSEIPYLDEKGDEYFKTATKEAIAVYAVARLTNALVSVAKETEMEISPFGVGVTVHIGQVLDPLDDATERLSAVLTTSMAVLGIMKISKERTIDVMITRLRQKIEINPKNPKYLQTIRGSGYVLWIE